MQNDFSFAKVQKIFDICNRLNEKGAEKIRTKQKGGMTKNILRLVLSADAP